jgi:mannose-6-phosphate isomerase
VAALALQCAGDSPQREPEVDFFTEPPRPGKNVVLEWDLIFLRQQKELAELNGNTALAQLFETRIQELVQELKRVSKVTPSSPLTGALHMVATAGNGDGATASIPADRPRDREGRDMDDRTLLAKAERGDPEGMAWLKSVATGQVPETRLVAALRHLSSHVLVPRPDNFTPESRTPWGGTVIPQLKRALGVAQSGTVVGESWEVSGHRSFPNRFAVSVDGKTVDVSLPVLEQLFPHLLYGRRPTKGMSVGMPYMVKLLNSGSWVELILALESLVGPLAGLSYHEIHRRLSQSRDFSVQYLHRQMVTRNLSVQVHPPADAQGLKPGEHSKTEAWAIISAEPGAGIYLGLQDGVTRQQFEDMLRDGKDVTSLLNFVAVKSGDVYFIPSGTMHAIGAGVTLVEPQEASDTTFRVFDFGRRDAEGKPRQLHIDQAMAVTQWDGPRGQAAVDSFRRRPQQLPASAGTTARVEQLLQEDVFALRRITLQPGATYASDVSRGLSSFTVLEGAVSVDEAGEVRGPFSKGQSLIVPMAVGQYTIRGVGEGPTVVFETTARP